MARDRFAELTLFFGAFTTSSRGKSYPDQPKVFSSI